MGWYVDGLNIVGESGALYQRRTRHVGTEEKWDEDEFRATLATNQVITVLPRPPYFARCGLENRAPAFPLLMVCTA